MRSQDEHHSHPHWSLIISSEGRIGFKVPSLMFTVVEQETLVFLRMERLFRDTSPVVPPLAVKYITQNYGSF